MSRPRPLRALLLAAGYGTRLGELGRSTPKPLLELGGRPLADHLLDDLVRIPGLVELRVVTNARFRAALQGWAQGAEARAPFPVHVLDDGTEGPDERLGAVGDLALALDLGASGPGRGGRPQGGPPSPPLEGLTGEPEDDWLVLSGDTLPGFPLGRLVREWGARPEADVLLTVESEADPERLRSRGVVAVDGAGRVTAFQEKPREAASNLTALPIYLFSGGVLPRIAEYLERGGEVDAPGHLVAWLVDRVRVEGWRPPGGLPRVDVGTPQGLEAARRRFKGGGQA